MGVKKLLTFLNNYKNLITEKNLSDYKGYTIAIDISLLIYKLVIGFRNTGTDIINAKGERITHIIGLFNKIILLLTNDIVPVFVFDGKPSELKYKTINDRKQIKLFYNEKLKVANNEEDKIKYFKKTTTVTKKELDECKELIELMGIPYIIAPEEADSQCAYLAKVGLVNAVYTDDMDVLTFGSPVIIKNLISIKNKPIEINLNNILNEIKLNYDQFIDFCILLGCDYSNGISNINYNIIYTYYLRNKNIIDTLHELKNNNYNVPNILDIDNIKEYYKNAPYTYITSNELKIKSFDKNKIIDLLVNKYGLIKFKVINKLNKI
jgi:flap endonuclease-1